MHRPTSTRVSDVLIPICAVIWLVFALITGAGLHPALPDGGIYRWGTAGLAFITAITLLLSYRKAKARIGFAYYFLTGLLLFLALFTLADEVGTVDIFVLAIHLAALISLIRNRARFIRSL